MKDDVKTETGFGATEADVQRGHLEVEDREKPAADLANYKGRATCDKHDPYGDYAMPDDPDSDYAFRNKGRRSKGFLTRPAAPTER